MFDELCVIDSELDTALLDAVRVVLVERLPKILLRIDVTTALLSVMVNCKVENGLLSEMVDVVLDGIDLVRVTDSKVGAPD